MRFFLLKFPTFCVSQNFVNVFQKALWSVCLSVCYKYHEDEWFRTSGFSPVHFRLLEPTTQDTLRNLKDGGQVKMKYSEPEGKRLQKNLWLGEASCGMQNRGEILLDSLCSLRLSNACS